MSSTTSLFGGRRTLLFWVGVALLIGFFLRDTPYAGIPLTGVCAVAALRRGGASVAQVLRATRLSRKWTAILLAVFGFTPLGAGHGVAPIGLLLVLGWEEFLVPIVLGWLGVATLTVSPWVATGPGRVLGLVGAFLLSLCVWLVQQRADDALLAMLVSIPFGVCVLVHVVHLARVRSPAHVTTT